MSIKQYNIFCEVCGYHRITDGSSPADKKMVEIPRGKIQREIPKLGDDSKTIESKFLSQPKMFKCPTCGRGVRIRKINQNEENNPT